MISINKHIALSFTFWMIALVGLTQNQYSLVQFSQFRPFINPASITTASDINGAMMYRNKWVGFNGAPTTVMANFNGAFRASNNYLSATIMQDVVGVNQNIQIRGTYAYKAKFDQYADISFAISPSINLIQNNFASITPEADQVDPLFAASENSAKLNFAFGAYYDAKYFFFGVSSPGLLNNYDGGLGNGGFNLSYLHYNIMGGYIREFNSKWKFLPTGMLSHAFGVPMNLEGSLIMQYNDIYGLGASYNTSNNLSFLFNIKFNSTFKLAYAYTLGLNQLNQYNSGSQEIMLVVAPKRKRAVINLPNLMQEYKKDHEKDLGSKDIKKEEDSKKSKNKEEKARQPYTGTGEENK